MEDPSDASWEQVREGIEAVIARWDEALARVPDERAAQRTVRRYLVDFVFPRAGGSPQEGAEFLFLLVRRFAELERTGDGLAVLEWIAELYAGHDDADVAVPALVALADVAVTLASHDDGPARAVAVLNRAADQVAPQAHLAIQRAACRAVAHGAFLTATAPVADGDRGIRQQAEPWRTLLHRWSGSGDVILRWRLAQAHFHIGLVHLLLGEDAAADDRFAGATAQWNGLAVDATVAEELDTEYFARGAYARRILRAVELPSRAANLTAESLTRPAANRWDRRRERHQAKELVRAAQHRHRRSVGEVKRWCCCGQPFALLLRNFGLLEWTVRQPGSDDTGGRGFHQVQTFTYQRRGDHVVRELGREVPIVQVATSQSAGLELDSWRFHGEPLAQAQLYLSNDSWFETVTHLVTLAETIIIWAEGMTPALAQEMAAVRAQGRTHDAVVLIEELDDDPAQRAPIAFALAQQIVGEDRDDYEAVQSLAKDLMPQVRPSRKQLTPESPDLAGFPHVVDLRQALPSDSAQHPAVLARRRHHQALWELPWDERMARLSERLGT
ncbi:hypothetical protein [Streptomyces guryensis]|uniref:Uncharacterized protein n=1 Tax=Streptomyces guryensis TaxID=2886947 RepID=A0A9Q3VMY3_9ACTN|nr:hypothetical protein [Streptomyces guryensis]MCD9874972.1 hypothetical protein [Streptomyces guryensis]